MRLPSAQLRAGLQRMERLHGRSIMDEDPELSIRFRDGVPFLVVAFADGLAWLADFDPEAAAVIQSLDAMKH